MHNDNDTYYVQTTNTTIFFFHLFFLFLLSWLFPDISGFFKEGEGMLLLKRGHVNYQYLLAHMVSNIKLILILLFLFSVFLLSPIFNFLIFSVSYFSKWLCHFILWNVFNHFFSDILIASRSVRYLLFVLCTSDLNHLIFCPSQFSSLKSSKRSLDFQSQVVPLFLLA